VEEHVRYLTGRRTGVTYDDLARMLERSDCKQVSSSGSHRTFRHLSVEPILTLRDSGSGEVLPVYIRKTRQFLEQVLATL